MRTQLAANTLEPLVRAMVTATTGASATEAELLTQFIDCRDEAALTAFVRRHGLLSQHCSGAEPQAHW